MQRQLPPVRKHDLVERHLDTPGRREVPIQNRPGKLPSAGPANLQDVTQNSSPQRKNQLVKGVDRLHQMPLNRLSRLLEPDLAIERNLERRPFEHGQSNRTLSRRVVSRS